MIKYLTLITSLFLIGSRSFCQVLVQDATGKSSILYQGSTINLDPTQTRISFSVNHFFNEKTKSIKPSLFLGVQALADSKNGLGGILKSGTVVPNADLTITVGGSWIDQKVTLAEVNEKKSEQQKQIHDKQVKLTNKADGLIKLAVSKLIHKKTKDDLITVNGTTLIADLPESVSVLIIDLQNEKDPIVIQEISHDNPILVNLVRRLQKIKTIFIESKEASDLKIQAFENELTDFHLKRSVAYAIIGASGSKFSYLQDMVSTNYEERFVDKTLETPKFGLGYNRQNGGKGLWGISVVGEKSDNFSSLDDKEYIITSTDQTTQAIEISNPKSSTTISTNLVSKKTITGYSGIYDTFLKATANLDYAHFIPGRPDKVNSGLLVLHGYVRQIITNKHEVVPNTTKLGIGLYTFKDNGLFSGGLYLEWEDIFNNAERQKPIPSFKPLYNRINFGIVTKFALSSILSYTKPSP